MKKINLLSMFIAVFLVFILTIGVAAAQDGSINGYVESGKEEPISGLELKLEATDNPMGGFEVIETTTTNENGYYEFNGLNTSYLYKVRAEYKGETFYSTSNLLSMGIPSDQMRGILSFMQEPANETTSNMTVYDGEENKDLIKIDYQHLIIQKSEGNLSISQTMIVNNTGTESFYGNLTTLNLINENNEEPVTEIKKFGLGPNKTKTITSNHTLPFTDPTTLQQELTLETSRYALLIDSATLNASSVSDNLEDMGRTTNNGRRYNSYAAGTSGDISEGETVSFTLKDIEGNNGTQDPEGNNDTQDPDREEQSSIVPFVIIGLLIIGFIVYTQRDKINFNMIEQEEESDSSVDSVEIDEVDESSLKRRKKAFLKKIDDLDKSYEDGEISEEEYRNKREKYKQMLSGIMAKLENKREEKEVKSEKEDKEPTSDLGDEKAELLEKISELEAKLERGDITEEEYEILNQEYRKELRKVMKELDNQ